MTRRTTATPVDGTDLRSALAAAVRGTVVTANDPGYPDALALHNAAIDNRPSAIVQVASGADVQRTLSFARRQGLRTSVRGGGHGLDGNATSGDIVIDLRALRGVTVDPQRRLATVRGGTTWAELDEATSAHGLVVPGSRVGSVGVVGSALAGGTGWLTPLFGPTSRQVLATESTTADGVTTSVGHRADMTAAVTSMTLLLHPLPSSALAGRLLYRLADAPEAIGALADLVAQGRPEFVPLVRWQLAPAAAYVPGDVVGRPVVAVLPAWVGDPVEGAEFLAPLHRAAAPLVEALGAMPYDALQRQLDGTSAWGRRRAERVALVPGDPHRIVGDLEAALTERPGEHAYVELAPPAPGERWSVRAEAQWLDPRDDARQQSWLSTVSSLLLPPNQPIQKEETS